MALNARDVASQQELQAVSSRLESLTVALREAEATVQDSQPAVSYTHLTLPTKA